MIFCDIKAPNTPAGLEFGPNFFRFPGTLSSVDQFTAGFKTSCSRKQNPTTLVFSISQEDLFRYSISQGEYDASFGSGKFTVSFNEPLAVILNGFVDMCNPKALTVSSSTQCSLVLGVLPQVDTMYPFEQDRVRPLYHNPPGDSNGGLGPFPQRRDSHADCWLCGVQHFHYNIRTKSDWIYTPTVFRHYTMNQSNTIDSYSIRSCCSTVMVFPRAHSSPGERFNVNIAFYPV
jgi:hypothetical protein